MVSDALSGDRIIGMALLKDTTAPLITDKPMIYSIGCSGLITHAESLDDGRFNVVLRGLEKFKILKEDCTGSYRQATTKVIIDTEEAVDQLDADRKRLEQALDHWLTTTGSESQIPYNMNTVDLVNALSHHLDFDPIEKQALLERDSVSDRCRSLIELIEIRTLLGERNFPHAVVQ